METQRSERVKKVYITNVAGHDFTPAKSYGELRFITTGYVSFQSLDRVKADIAQSILESDPEDWLCLTGVPILQVVSAVAWFYKHGKVNLLVWDRKKRDRYRELKLSKHNFDEIWSLCNEQQD